MTEDAPIESITLEKPTDLPGALMTSFLGFDYNCSNCDYNMRGLTLDGFCPECGISVAFGIRNSRLLFQPIPYIHRLSKGALLCFAGWFAAFIWAVLDVLFMISMYVIVYPDFVYDFLEIGSIAYLTLSAVIAFVGLAMLSKGAPETNKRRKNNEHSTWVSSCTAAITVPIVVTNISLLGYSVVGGSSAMTYALIIVGVPALLSSIFCYFGGLQHIRLLARLVPTKRGDRIALYLLWAPLFMLIPLIGMLASVIVMILIPILFFHMHKQFQLVEAMASELQQLQRLAESSDSKERLFAASSQ